VQYYYIKDLKLYGKAEGLDCYLWDGTKWCKDNEWVIQDRLCGFDDTADADDPYGFGDTEVLNSIVKITEDDFKQHKFG